MLHYNTSNPSAFPQNSTQRHTTRKQKTPRSPKNERKAKCSVFTCKEEMGDEIQQHFSILPLFWIPRNLRENPNPNPSPTTKKPSNVPRINHLFGPYKNQSFNRDQQKEEKQSKTLGHCSLRSLFLSISRERREVSRDLQANRERDREKKKKKEKAKARVKKTALKRPFL